MKKTIWLPIVIGLVAGGLNYMTWAVDFKIPIPTAAGGYMGMMEIFNILTAALGGPIAAVIDDLLYGIGGHLAIRPILPWPESLYISIADIIAHLVAMLAAAFCYRFLYERARQKPLAFFTGWVLIVAIYYCVFLSPLQVFLVNIASPGFIPSYISYLIGTGPEILLTTVMTTLVMIALPLYSRHPLWYERKA